MVYRTALLAAAQRAPFTEQAELEELLLLLVRAQAAGDLALTE
jgi:hypothetical protein